MKSIATKVVHAITGRALWRRRRQRRDWQEMREAMLAEQNRLEGVFDALWYLAANPDVRVQGVDPASHYLHHGASENRKPGPNFDGAFYLDTYPDVVTSGENPLIHYIRVGRAEGRFANSSSLNSSAADCRYEVVKDFVVERRGAALGETAIFVTHAPAGRLKPHVLSYIGLLADNGISSLLVVVADCPVQFRPAELAAASGIIVRENLGYDFAAWSHGLRLFPEIWGAVLLYIVNDSVVPSSDPQRFSHVIQRVRMSAADIVGLTASHEYAWHVQSYFLAIKPVALSSWAFQHFVREIEIIHDKDVVIQTYEVPFAARMQASGLSIEVLFDAPDPTNPTLFGWRELIRQGFPFVKLLLLRGKFPAADTHGWKQFLKTADFDIALIEASISASETNLAGATGHNLLADPEQRIKSPSRPLRVAYLGPWNYECGLGQAGRELLCALRRTGCLLNIYPISKPFHVHRLISPAVETSDFAGRPDIAIVHLNPDSWHLLTSAQLAIIQSAHRRIGYWVWETDTVPQTWQPRLNAVDRVWAPSQYCADVFANAIDVPIDVVPHPVPVPARQRQDRERAWATAGLPAGSRIILYVFDGASYLVRKNPAALIRAFGSSGLQAQGWRLVLKTKHLLDQPEAGQGLKALAAENPGVVLMERELDGEELASLMAAADIYASPHCSEGFGLTVAEAMALGKPVVATDYSGTRDYLDASCGYPVLAHPSELTRDHGLYLAGHGWATVDDEALAVALRSAAAAVEAGDEAIGEAARATIAAKFSYDAVADVITPSLAAAMAQTDAKQASIPPSPAAPVLPMIDTSGATKFADARADAGIIPLCLDPDLHWRSQLPQPSGATDWYFIAPRDAKLAPGAFNFVKVAIAARPDVSVFYADDLSETAEPLDRVRLKPDFDATLIAVQDYIGAPVIIRAALLRELGLDSTKGSAALYHLVLRAAQMCAVARIPHVLICHDGARNAVNSDQRRALLKTIPQYADYVLDDRPSNRTALVRRSEPNNLEPVTIVIPTTRSGVAGTSSTHIERLLDEIALTDWPMTKLTVIVGDDIAGPAAWTAASWPFRLRHVGTARSKGSRFNYAEKMNRLWRIADDEQLIFMNDDVVPRDRGWLKALQTFARRERVGGVGALLYYETGAIQHAGIFPGLGTAIHAWAGLEVGVPTYQDWAFHQREWSMVTGAVFATRRSVMERLDGFDERFSLEFNDIDLCLRMRSLGYQIVYTPVAEFAHTEKASRGAALPPAEEMALFLSRWSAWLTKDPASHPGYARNRHDLVPAIDPQAWYFGKA